MVTLLVRLKLTLLRNSLRRSVWRTVGLIIGIVYGLGVVAAVLVGLFALRFTSTDLTADVTVVFFSALSVGWLLMSLLVFGIDETVDPSKFALLPVRARELLPGLLAAGLIGVPGVATVLISGGLIITWARTPALAGRGRGRGPARCGHLRAAGPGRHGGVRGGARVPAIPGPGLCRTGPVRGGAGSGRQLDRCLRLLRCRAAAGKPGRPGPGGRLVPVRLGLDDSGRCGPGSVAGRRNPSAARGRPGRAALVGLGVLPGRAADLPGRSGGREPKGPRVQLGGSAVPGDPGRWRGGPVAPLLAPRPSLSRRNRRLHGRSGDHHRHPVGQSGRVTRARRLRPRSGRAGWWASASPRTSPTTGRRCGCTSRPGSAAPTIGPGGSGRRSRCTCRSRCCCSWPPSSPAGSGGCWRRSPGSPQV